MTDVPRRASINTSGLFICVGGFTSPCGKRERGMVYVYLLQEERERHVRLRACMTGQLSYCKAIEAVGVACL